MSVESWNSIAATIAAVAAIWAAVVATLQAHRQNQRSGPYFSVQKVDAISDFFGWQTLCLSIKNTFAEELEIISISATGRRSKEVRFAIFSDEAVTDSDGKLVWPKNGPTGDLGAAILNFKTGQSRTRANRKEDELLFAISGERTPRQLVIKYLWRDQRRIIKKTIMI